MNTSVIIQTQLVHGLSRLGATLLILVSTSLGAQDPGAARPATPLPSPAATALPPPPTRNPSVDYFRQLLSSKGTEREQLLNRHPEQREQYKAFISAYESKAPEERERRLQALELRLIITSILRLQPGSRTQAVARLPESIRPIAKARVDFVNQLAPDKQKLLLENEQLMRWVTYVAPGGLAPPMPTGPGIGNRTNMTANQILRLETAIQDWNSLSAGKREQIEGVFRRVFVKGEAKAAELLPTLTQAQIDQMQATLDRFQRLTIVQKRQCITNFSRLAELSVVERQEFLRSAEEWQKMSPEDREAWRDLIKSMRVLPPPPSLRARPPMPIGPKTVPPLSVVVDTNRPH